LPTYTAGTTEATASLAAAINDAIQGVPTTAIPSVVTDVVSKYLRGLFNGYISEMVPSANIDVALNAAVLKAEMPSANLTVAVYSYKGA
jgi:phage tail tape-measure protein